MVYTNIRFSSELPRPSTSTQLSLPTTTPRLSTTESYWTSPTTLYAHPGLDTAVPKSKSSPMSSIRKAVDHMTEEYWAAPSPLWTPRTSGEQVRKAGEAREHKKAGKTERGFVERLRRGLNRGTQEYWANREMSAMYGGVVPKA
jgi:hypothetical protein